MKWLEMTQNDMKWYEMIWKDVKGYEKILTEANICKGLFTRVIGVPFLMWQRQTHATISGHFWSEYDLAWPKSSNDHSVLLCSMIFCRTCCMNKDPSVLTVKLATGLDEWTCSTWQIQSSFRKFTVFIRHHTLPTQSKLVTFFSFWYVAGGWCLSLIDSYARSLGKAHRSTFLFGSLA